MPKLIRAAARGCRCALDGGDNGRGWAMAVELELAAAVTLRDDVEGYGPGDLFE